jgi:hypothetical protein
MSLSLPAVKAKVKELRESAREIGRGISPRYKTGTVPLVIDELISPLRYDVLVRSQFFELLAAERALFDRSPEQFVALARDSDYYRWYRTVAVHAIGIAGQDDAAIEEAFAKRVRRSAALADSVARRGFIAKPPLTIRTSAGELTTTGKRMGPRHYPLDGCHRLALLRQLGRKELRPGEYRVTAGHGPLLDNTARLLPVLGLTEATYAPYLASGYLDAQQGGFTTVSAVVAAVGAEQPARRPEVASVAAADQPLLGREQA